MSLYQSDKSGIAISLLCFKSIIDQRAFIYRILLLPILCLTLFDLTITKIFTLTESNQLILMLTICNLSLYFYFYCCVAYRWMCYLIKKEQMTKLIDNYIPNKPMINFSIEMIGLIMLMFAMLMTATLFANILQPLAAVIFFILFMMASVYFITPIYIKLAITARELPIKMSQLLTLPHEERRQYFSLTISFIIVKSCILLLFFFIIGTILLQIFNVTNDVSSPEEIIALINMSGQETGLTIQFFIRLFTFSFSFITMLIYMKFISILYLVFMENRSISNDV